MIELELSYAIKHISTYRFQGEKTKWGKKKTIEKTTSWLKVNYNDLTTAIGQSQINQ